MKTKASLVIIIFNFFMQISGCSSNAYNIISDVIVDERKDIMEAQRWMPYFVKKDTGNGIIVELNKASDIKELIARLYSYPLDTTMVTTTYFESLSFPAPPNTVINKTRIYYEFGNKSVATSLIDSLNRARFNLKPGRYLIRLLAPGYLGKWIKEIVVIENKWSVVKVELNGDPMYHIVY